MLLQLTHTTDLTYSDLISESVMELRMAPLQEQGQHRLSFTLAIGPATTAMSYFDWLGNTVHTFTVNGFHRQIKIVATSVVETDPDGVGDARALPDAWPVSASDYAYENYDFLQFGGPVVDSPALRHLAASLRPKHGTPLGELAVAIRETIHETFAYQKGVTNAASPITEMFDHKSGVCQDFTHLMTGVARVLGVPARYVSGFIHPDAGKLKGFTQTHAWCEMLFPSVGWVGFDPANDCQADENFVKVAVGRDYRDVPPNRGIFRGRAKEAIDVRVESTPLDTVPPELAAERYSAIDIPAYPAGSVGHREMVNQQQEVQQQ